MMDKIENVMRQIGSPGRYHIVIYILLCLNNVVVILNHLAMALFGAKTEYFCENSDLQNQELASSDSFTSDYDGNSSYQMDACDHGNYSVHSNVSHVSVCPPGWSLRYVMEPRETNIISEFGLICDQFYLKNLSTTVYFCGVMVGGLIFGSLSDLFGRKPFMLLTLYGQIIIGVGIAFSKNYIMFVFLRFIQGILMQGLQTCSLVLIMELFTAEYLAIAGTVFEVFWGFGVCYLAFLGWVIRNWRYLQLAMCLPSLITIVYIWVVPESFRWLMYKKRCKEVEKILKKAAKFNNVTLEIDPLGLNNPIQNGGFIKQDSKETDESEEDQDPQPVYKYSIWDMFRTPRLRLRSFVMFYVWFVISCGYYGLSLSITSLAGNKYLNLFLGGLFELPAYCIGPFLVSKVGRRPPLAVYFFIGGVTCIAAGVMPKETRGTNLQILSLVLAIMGRFCFAGCFGMIFLYTSELFPTVIRNFSLGACSCWTRIGGVIAPQVLLLGQVTVIYLPVIVFGGLALLAAFLTCLLPETRGTTLPDTILEAEILGNKPLVESYSTCTKDVELSLMNENQNPVKDENVPSLA